MRIAAAKRIFAATVACGSIVLLGGFGGLDQNTPAAASYPGRVPIEQYLMDRNAEIALARSAAPDAISRDATVLVLGRDGYEVAERGTNGFVCMVERGWVGPFDAPEFWNPKIRGADCLNAPAAKSILPLAELRTKLVMEGRTQQEIIDAFATALRKGALPAPQPGAMSYMMGRGSYLTDLGHHNMPHLMFFIPLEDAAAWGADLPGSPVGSGAPYWFFSREQRRQYSSFPPMRIFVVHVADWSDGTPAMH